MQDRRIEILMDEFDPKVDDCRTVEDDLKLAIILNPDIEKIKNAMDTYATEMCLDLLKYMSEKGVECDNEKSEGIFWLNGKWVSAKQLFENFL